MFVAFETRVTCLLCGYRMRCLWMDYVRVNKRSMRKTGGGPAITWIERRCTECRWPSPTSMPVTRYVPTPVDAAKIRAYRLRRWPQLAEEGLVA